MPAHAKGVVIMVKQRQKAALHIIRHNAKLPGGRHGRNPAAEKQHEPPQGKPCREGHADENEQKYQTVPHIPGNKEVKTAHDDGVGAHH